MARGTQVRSAHVDMLAQLEEYLVTPGATISITEAPARRIVIAIEKPTFFANPERFRRTSCAPPAPPRRAHFASPRLASPRSNPAS